MQREESLRHRHTNRLHLWQIHAVIYENDPDVHFAQGRGCRCLGPADDTGGDCRRSGAALPLRRRLTLELYKSTATYGAAMGRGQHGYLPADQLPICRPPASSTTHLSRV
jgi:hypothetical protein